MFVAALVLALGALGWLNWQSVENLKAIESAINHTQDLQRVALQVTRLVADDIAGIAPITKEKLDEVTQLLSVVVNPSINLSEETPAKLKESLRILNAQDSDTRRAAATAVALVREVLYEETGAQARVLAGIGADVRAKANLVTAAVVVLPLLLLVGLWLLRHRIVRPLNDLKDLLSRLANGEFAPVYSEHPDPLLLPLFQNYNQMVTRLTELERAHFERAASLESEVRVATHALLQQQHALARGERLAAVGELSATVAHELRNPLASIQMTLTNLRRDVNEAGLVQRLDLVITEVQRITRLLNDLLTRSKHSPEPRRLLALGPAVRELLQLTGYQFPAHVKLRAKVPEDIACLMPADGLRQALLNLVLNSVHSLSGRAGEVIVQADTQNEVLRLSVRDNGPGFPETVLTNGIRSFASGREAGTGLGLAMVRRFVREMEGELRLSNLDPHGACVELVLPCCKQHG